MSEKTIGPDGGERQKRLEDAVKAKLETLAQRHEERLADEVAQIIGDYEAPDRSDVPDLKGDVAEVGNGRVHLSSPTEREYARMPEEERSIRSPDTDHWSAQWLRGLFKNDNATRIQAEAKLEGLGGRADTLEGAADAAGGFAAGTGATLLPRPLEALVEIARDRVAKMQRFATTYRMTAQEHNIPTAAAMTAFMVGEATSPVTQGEPTMTQVPLLAHVGAVKAIAGTEILEDAAINLVSVFASRGGKALGVLEDQQFFSTGTGSGSNVTKLSGTAFSETTSAALGYNDVISIYHTLQQEYRDGARWFIASNVLEMLSNVRDGQGRPFYQGLTDVPGPVTDDPTAVGTILRKPVHEVVLADGDVWFGDASACYAIGRRRGITVDVSRDVLFETRRVMWLITQRFAGNNVDTAAAQLCTGITSATSL